jgi:tRNA threonylcarbamoyl adenosine modification protein YeaZ
MRKLVIDTTSEYLSIALFDDDELIAADHHAIGRGHAEKLVPAIAALPGGGKADSIWVGCGPGSFTGTRVGIAAARALAFAWGAKIYGFDSLALVAAGARRLTGCAQVSIVCEGGHGEWLVADAPMAWHALGPDEAPGAATFEQVAGNRSSELVAMRGFGTAVLAVPDAREACGLAPEALFTDIHALYARAPDAKPSLVAAHAT